MEGSFIGTEARLLVSKLLVRKNVSEYMYRLATERLEVFNHSINVAYLTAEIVLDPHFNELRFKDGDPYIEDIVMGALLHDIGKLQISNEILLKPDSLSDDEFRECQKHPLLGYEMIKDDPDISDVTKNIVLSHHEKKNGQGYPFGKRGDEVGVDIQIVSACDIFDAVTEIRSYRTAGDLLTAFRILSSEPIDLDIFLSLASCKDK